MKPLNTVACVACLAIASSASVRADTVAPLAVSLSVRNPLSIARVGWPVTSGVPIPREATDGIGPITSTNQLTVQRPDGTTVPAQFRVLARWGSRDDATARIRWVLVDLQADVPANGVARYWLMARPNPPSPSGPVTVTDSPSGVTVDTGALQFTISRKMFNLFDSVQRGTDTLVGSSTANGVLYTAYDGTDYPSATTNPDNTALQVAVEEAGPLKAVVRVRGAYKLLYRDSIGRLAYLTYTARYYAYAGKDWVRVVFTLEDNGRGVQPNGPADPYEVVFIRRLHAILSLNLSFVKTVTFEGYTDTFSSSERYQFRQVHALNNPRDESANFAYSSWKDAGGGPVQVGRAGSRAAGWADLSDGQRGLTIASRWFWQSYPKAFYVHGSTLEFGIFPDGLGDVSGKDDVGSKRMPGTLYRFRGGYYKTTEMLFWFHGSDTSERDSLVACFQSPLMALADPDWYSSSGAFYEPIAGRDKWTPSNTGQDARLRDALSRYEDWMRARWDASAATPGVPSSQRSVDTVRESRQDGALDLYGWEDFGCTAWQNGHSGLHYDWPWGMVLQFLRTGDPGAWELAQQMTIHSVDIDLIHMRAADHTPLYAFERTYMYWMERYENDAHNTTWAGDHGPRRSHSWVRGKVAYYLLTGDERVFEDAWAMADATRASITLDPGQFARPETRFMGWSIEGMLSVYAVTNEQPLLDASLQLFRKMLDYEAHPNDVPQGYSNVRGYNDAQSYDETITNESYYADPLIQLYRASGDPGVLAYLLREAYWVKNRYLLGGKLDSTGLYYPYSGVSEYWTEQDPGGANRYTQNLWLLVNLMAFAWQQTGLREFRDLARAMFADSVLYWGYWRPPDNVTPIVPTAYDAVYMGEMYQMSKEQGKVQRAFQLYLWLERNPPPTDGVPPSAVAAAASAEVGPDADVQLQGHAVGALRTTWYLGDGSDPIGGTGDQNIAHRYAKPGIYTATFEAVSAKGAIARASVVVRAGVVPNLFVQVTADRSTCVPGDVISLNVVIANKGDGTATKVSVTLPLPTQVELLPDTVRLGSDAVSVAQGSGGSVAVGIGTLPPGASIPLSLSVRVK